MSEAILKPRGYSRLETGHPWIFKSDVEPVEANNGAIVDVVAKGRFLGQAFYSEHSEVTLRMLSRGALAETWLVGSARGGHPVSRRDAWDARRVPPGPR